MRISLKAGSWSKAAEYQEEFLATIKKRGLPEPGKDKAALQYLGEAAVAIAFNRAGVHYEHVLDTYGYQQNPAFDCKDPTGYYRGVEVIVCPNPNFQKAVLSVKHRGRKSTVSYFVVVKVQTQFYSDGNSIPLSIEGVATMAQFRDAQLDPDFERDTVSVPMVALMDIDTLTGECLLLKGQSVEENRKSL